MTKKKKKSTSEENWEFTLPDGTKATPKTHRLVAGPLDEPPPRQRKISKLMRIDNHGIVQLAELTKVSGGESVLHIDELVRQDDRNVKRMFMVSAVDPGSHAIRFVIGEGDEKKELTLTYGECAALWSAIDIFIRHSNLTSESNLVEI